MLNNFKMFYDLLNVKSPKKMAVVLAEDTSVIEAVSEAKKTGLVNPVLIGDSKKIKSIIEELDENSNSYDIVDISDPKEASVHAVCGAKSGEYSSIMKGKVSTGILLKEVVNKETGIAASDLLSHTMVYEIPTYDRLLFLSDGGVCIAPNEKELESIANNSIKFIKRLGYKNVNVAFLSAQENENPKMPSTILAKNTADKVRSNDVLAYGPIALDCAISEKSAKIKGLDVEIAGKTDLVIVPNIETGNVFGKSLTYFAKAKSCGVVLGAKVPIVLTSRADNMESKLYSIILSVI